MNIDCTWFWNGRKSSDVLQLTILYIPLDKCCMHYKHSSMIHVCSLNESRVTTFLLNIITVYTACVAIVAFQNKNWLFQTITKNAIKLLLPAGVFFGIWNDVALWTGSGCFANPKECIWPSSIVSETFDKQCRLVYCIDITLNIKVKTKMLVKMCVCHTKINSRFQANTLILCANSVKGPIRMP